MKFYYTILLISFLFLGTQNIFAQNKQAAAIEMIVSNVTADGNEYLLRFETGKYHNHPSFAVWLEDVEGNFIQPLFVTKSVATGIFRYGELEKGVWGKEPGQAFRPSALPYFFHKRQAFYELEALMPDPDNPVVDAYTGATPASNFTLDAKADESITGPVRVLLEVNQPWDWNEHWYNDKFPDEQDYKYSCQPSVVYSVTIDEERLMDKYVLNPIGHGHYAGKDGQLYTDLSTLSTSLSIFSKVTVQPMKK